MPAFDYAPAPESRDVARLRASYGIFVDGQFRVGAGEAIKTVNPANEEPLAEVAEAGPADVADAVQAARNRSGASQIPVPDRSRHPGASP
jgi:aldehyde dehydrogenase (NAD+)